jgi:hypothetical protein
MGWAKPGPARPSPAHGLNFFEKKTMGWAGLTSFGTGCAGRVNFTMGTHGPNLNYVHVKKLVLFFLFLFYFYIKKLFDQWRQSH